MSQNQAINSEFARAFLTCHQTSVEDQEFFCTWCDGNRVNSEDPNTGTFFFMSGHEHYRDDADMPWKHIIFAICSECLKGNTRFGENGANNSSGVNV